MAFTRSTRSITRGQVGGRVVEAAVGLAHDQRQGLAVAVREAGREDDLRAVGLDQHAGLVQAPDDLGQQVVVGALAHQVRVLQEDPEPAVDRIEVAGALLDQAGPEAQRRRDRRPAAATTRWRARSRNSSSASNLVRACL